MIPKLIKLSLIKPHKRNPRLIRDENFEKLKKSIIDFPKMLELRPIVIDENNVILGGNMRYKALKDLGYKESYVVKVSDLTEEQKKEFIIKDNVGFGEWEWDLLSSEWDELKLKEWGLEIYEPEELIEEEHNDKQKKENTNIIAISLTDDETEEWNKTKEKLGFKSDKKCIFELINLLNKQS
jgi:ParB-like chromosome segregation protein Spo0J